MEQTEKNRNLADKQIALTKGGTLNLTILTLDGYGVQIQSRGVNVCVRYHFHYELYSVGSSQVGYIASAAYAQ